MMISILNLITVLALCAGLFLLSKTIDITRNSLQWQIDNLRKDLKFYNTVRKLERKD